jgi:hypothetical protein
MFQKYMPNSLSGSFSVDKEMGCGFFGKFADESTSRSMLRPSDLLNTLFLKMKLHRFAFLALLWLAADCKPEDSSPSFVNYLLRITHKVGGVPLVSNSLFTDTSGQKFSVTRLNYYISNVRLRNQTTGEVYFETDSYHLVNALKSPANTEILLKGIPRLKFTQLEFSIGVDNAANHSTDKRGDLDPAKGMAWDWTTGYKFLEMEGNYETSTKTGSYLFHVGEDASYRTLRFNFADVLAGPLNVEKDGQILLDADIAAVLGQPNPVDLNTFNNVMSVSAGATKIADNYAQGLFKLVGAQ